LPVATGKTGGSGLIFAPMDLKTLSNTNLVKLCAQEPRDERTWTEFYARFDDYIRLMIGRECRQKNLPHDKVFDDLVQDVYLRVVQKNCKALWNFKAATENSIYTYLAVIAHNVVCSYLIREGAQKRPRKIASLDAPVPSSQDDSELRLIDIVPSTDPAPDAALDKESERQEIRQLLDQIITGKTKARDKLIFTLYWFEKFSPEQIAAHCGIDLSVKRIINIISAIKKRLPQAQQRPDFS
jgi:RNA polymerase sigma factor (sigma-70 family)